MKKSLFLAAVAALSMGLSAAPAQAIVIGEADGSNSMPFGSTLGGYFYRQVSNAGSFGDGLDISQISFYNSITPGGTPRSGSFNIYLSTTTEAIPTFDTASATTFSWVPTDGILVYSGELPTLADGRLDFDLSSVFNYDATAGNLLLTVSSFDFGGGSLFLDTDANTGLTNSRYYAASNINGYNWDQGLVTGFNDVAAVPEPASWAMMIAGFGLTGAAMRRRRTAATAFA